MLGTWRLLRKQLAAAGDLNLVTGDGSSQVPDQEAHLPETPVGGEDRSALAAARMARANGCFE